MVSRPVGDLCGEELRPPTNEATVRGELGPAGGQVREPSGICRFCPTTAALDDSLITSLAKPFLDFAPTGKMLAERRGFAVFNH